MDEGAAQSQIGPTGQFEPVQVLLEKYGSWDGKCYMGHTPQS